MAEVSIVEFKVISDRAKRNTEQLRKSFANVDKQVKKTQKQFKEFSTKSSKNLGNLKGAITGLVAAFGLFKIGKFLTDTIREFEKLRAVLKTVTGSAANADKAFDVIKDFTATTPFQLEEVTQAFINFKNAGLEPNAEFLKDFGNIAAATGKSIVDISETVFAATTGEFERLKALGILVRKEGDKLSVTFQGATRTIDNTRESIIGFLRDIGRVDFAGALEEQSKTLNGILSNIQDQFKFLAFEIGEGGLRQALGDVAKQFATITKVGNETARAIGVALGDAVRATGEAFFFVLENIKAFGVLLGALVIGKVVVSLVAMVGAVGKLATAFKLLNIVLLRNPIVAIGVAIVAIVSAFVLWTKETAEAEGVNASFFDILVAIKDVLLDALEPAIDNIIKSWNDFTTDIAGVGNSFKRFVNRMIAATLLIGDAASIFATRFVNLFTNAFSKVSDLGSAFADGLKNIFTGNFSGAFDAFEKEFAKGFSSAFDGTLQELAAKAKERFGTDFVGDAGEAIAEVVGKAITGINETIEGAILKPVLDRLKENLDGQREINEQTARTADLARLIADEDRKNLEIKQLNAAATTQLNTLQDAHLAKLKAQEETLQFQLLIIGKTVTEVAILTAARDEEASATSAASQAVRDNIVALQAEIREKQFGANFKAYIQSIRDERAALVGNRNERELNVAILRQENAAKAAGTELTKEQIALIRTEITLLQQARDAAAERDRVEQEAKRRVIDAEKLHQKEIRNTATAYNDTTRSILNANNAITNSIATLIERVLNINTGSASGGFFSSLIKIVVGGLFSSIFGSSSSSSLFSSSSSSSVSLAPFTPTVSSIIQPIITINASGDANDQMLDDIASAVVAGIQEAQIETLRS